jgi:ubiquinone/menaquinone biosynthesis C-methylase UbiE
MNYGFADLESESTRISLEPEHEWERYCIQLYHHVVNDVNLHERDVLEVGCGRGGGAAYLHGSFNPRSFVGLDYSKNSIRFCQQQYEHDGLMFVHGDAESIHFPPDSFDIVLNVESSHCYLSMEAFLSGVRKVLRPGGYFLFADFRHGGDVNLLRSQMINSGLTLIHEEDITPNIIRGMELDRERKSSLIGQISPKWLVKSAQNFAGEKNSYIWRGLTSGNSRYLRMVLQHP